MGLWRTEKYEPKFILQEFHVQGNNETVITDLFWFKGSVQVFNMIGEIRQAISVSNITDVYLRIYDGVNIKNITMPGGDFSNICYGSFFSKMKDMTEEIVLHISDENRVTELKIDNIGQPILLTAKEGSDNYMQLCLSTNTVVDFIMGILIQYRLIDGGVLLPI